MFARDYLKAMQWTDCNEDSPEMQDAEFSASLLAEAASVCADFVAGNEADLDAYQLATGYSGGVDFWLTRNGHGAGFWDRGLGALGDRLTSAAKVYGGMGLYLDDNGEISAC